MQRPANNVIASGVAGLIWSVVAYFLTLRGIEITAGEATGVTGFIMIVVAHLMDVYFPDKMEDKK